MLFAGVVSIFPQKKSDYSQRELRYYPSPFFIPDDYSPKFMETFYLIQKANSGDPIAQHALAIRYLLGDGVENDTVKSVFWLRKAAGQDLPAAKYNLGIFEFNGWHTEWAPFSAFKHFLYAAESGMREAQLAIGILYTEDLIVRRNFPEALKWLSKASLSGSTHAAEKLELLEKRGLIQIDSAQKKVTLTNKLLGQQGRQADKNEKALLQYIDFEADTIETPSDTMLFYDAIDECPGLDTLGINFTDLDQIKEKMPLIKTTLEKCALYGNPEALTLLGRIYETGYLTQKNLIKAAYYYVKGVRVESPRSAFFLWRLVNSPVFMRQLTSLAGKKDPAALFISARLSLIGVTSIPDHARAAKLLQSAESESADAAMELAFCYLQGKGVKEDYSEGINRLSVLADKGMAEAAYWYALFSMSRGEYVPEKAIDPDTLEEAVFNGSLPALVVRGIMYRDGINRPADFSKAADNFRRAASRGSASSYSLLKRLYDERRPDEDMFN
ncbi:MAG: SEL1-like repeat protein [Ignavibacteriaceae bacterium]|nr:SEL1-like repeat protein [Ignavibacteriaceae bacterium]